MKNRDKLKAFQADRILWSIHPATLAQIRAKMESEAWLDEEDEEKKPVTPPSILTVKDGLGTIPITGTLISENHWLFWWFGETSYEGIQRAAAEARNRNDVQAVKLLNDSPGGLVAGAHDTSEAIRQLAQVKPVVGDNANLMASAAYWVNAHATHIVSRPTAFSGSVGVATVHREISGLERRIGVKSTDIASGDLKRIGSFYEPLTEEARAYIQQQCIDCAQVFVDDVAGARRLSAEQKADVARAGTYLGAQAVSIGLVDSTGLSDHADHVVNSLREARRTIVDLGRANANQGGSDMTPEEQKKMKEDAAKEALAQDRVRFKAVIALTPSTASAELKSFIQELATDGKTKEEAAVAILDWQEKNPPKAETTKAKSEAGKKQEGLQQFIGESTPPLKVEQKPAKTDTKSEQDAVWDKVCDVAVAALNKTNARGYGAVQD